MLKILRSLLLSYPLNVIAWKFYCKIFKIKIPQLKQWQQLFYNKRGIEIGGPSGVFDKAGYLPLYELVQSLDGVNFDKETIWEGTLKEGDFYKYGNKTGHQYITEGTDLSLIEDNKYEFVLSCNNLEHIANPLKAIYEWKRIIKKNGYILLILPNKVANFDHNRPYSTLEHIINDFKNNIGETDLTHLDEILKLHDLSRDPKAGGFKKFEKRCHSNINNRCMHHHVFSDALLKEMLEYAGMKVILQYNSKTDLFIAAIKP